MVQARHGPGCDGYLKVKNYGRDELLLASATCTWPAAFQQLTLLEGLLSKHHQEAASEQVRSRPERAGAGGPRCARGRAYQWHENRRAALHLATHMDTHRDQPHESWTCQCLAGLREIKAAWW